MTTPRLPSSLVAAILLVVAALPASAQPAPSTAPATGPATQPQRPRKAVSVPPGFKLIEDGPRRALCQPADEAWVRDALADRQPTTRPTTMPSDLLARVTAQRDDLVARMAADLAMPDPAAARALFDEQLIPLLRRTADFHAPIFFLVTTRDGLRDLVKNGWSDPQQRYHYNRAAGQVSIDKRLTLTIDGDSDDQVLAVLYDPGDEVPARRDRLTAELRGVEGQLAYEVANRTLLAVQLQFVNFITTSTVEPMNLPREQQWFGVGLIGVLSARYLETVNGSPPDSILNNMIVEDRRNPVRQQTIDLMNPMDLLELREVARPAYATAMQRKSTGAVKALVDRAGPGALPKVIAALRAAPPKDGPGLVTLIVQQTGIDLTSELQAR